MTIGEKIRDIRIKRGLTQADLGGDLVTPSMISQIEADRARASYPLLSEIANRLGMPVEYFMNEMDQQFLFSAQMSIAMYQSATHHPDEALKYLNAIEDAPDQGLNHQEHILTLVQVNRKLRRYSESVSSLEHLREIGYRMQDDRLLFHVCRESGYIEYETNNPEGAIHEWKRAVEFGEKALEHDAIASLDLVVYLIETLLHMDSVTMAEADKQYAHRPYLAKARELTEKTPDLRSVSDQFIEEAARCLHTDTGRAKLLAERANTLLTFARLVEHVVVVETRLSDSTNIGTEDPWQEAAKAITSIYPDVFLASECTQVEKLVRSGSITEAEDRLVRANAMFHALPDSREDELKRIEWRLQLLEAQVWLAKGKQREACLRLEEMVEYIPPNTADDIKTKVYALLVMAYGEARDVDKVLQYCKAMESLVSKQTNPPLFV